MKVDSLLEQLVNTFVRRSALYQSYEDCINKFKSNKDNVSFQNQRKKIESDHKQLTQQIGVLNSKLKAEGSDYSEKVTDIIKVEIV